MLLENWQDHTAPAYRIPADLQHPPPTEEVKRRGHPMKGSRVIIHTEQASTLQVNAASVARELLEALEAYGQAMKTWEATRAQFKRNEPRQRDELATIA